MPSKLSFLNSLMDTKKPPKEDNNNSTDELAFVKAAAWAWYQHGSTSKEKTTTEFDATITRSDLRPSRYKVEAMRMSKEVAKQVSPIHTDKLSLLDAYEVQSISRQLNSLIQCPNHIVCGSNNSVDVGCGRMRKKKIRKGLWLRHGVVCGREEDAVDPRALRDARRS
ncbi:hypothetical protein VNO77_32161 [Canavalia gladiata]|uniref:Uncharacterized protein n=1 Tax=Canavalia gladiata TaxID=3824 RepID=A0AAN9KPU7_CANGL